MILCYPRLFINGQYDIFDFKIKQKLKQLIYIVINSYRDIYLDKKNMDFLKYKTPINHV